MSFFKQKTQNTEVFAAVFIVSTLRLFGTAVYFDKMCFYFVNKCHFIFLIESQTVKIFLFLNDNLCAFSSSVVFKCTTVSILCVKCVCAPVYCDVSVVVFR